MYNVIVVVPVSKFDIGRCLREAEGYPYVDQQPIIPVVVILSPRPPSAEIIILFPVSPSPPLSGRIKRKIRRKIRRR